MILNLIPIWNSAKTSLIRNYNMFSFHRPLESDCIPKFRIDWRQQNLISLVESCSTMRELTQVHAQILQTGFGQHVFVIGRIILFCSVSELGSMDYAVALFRQLQYPDEFLWNTMIRGFGRSNRADEAFRYYRTMRKIGISIDNFTLSFLLKICSHLDEVKLGEQLHCCVIKQGFHSQVYVSNSLIHMYGLFKDLVSAKKVFKETSNVDLVSWNSLLVGYKHCALYKEVLKTFLLMLRNGFKSDEATLVVVLSACSELGSLQLGTWVHLNSGHSAHDGPIAVSNSLINMYSNCGAVDRALEVFEDMKQKNLVSWNSMIRGLAKHGQSIEALKLFRRMEELKSEEPNDITFVAVLNACSHGGLLEEGKHYFNLMKVKYGISPNIKHYGCMVDLFGRAGLLKEAYEMIVTMPINCNAIVWRTLLGDCRLHADVELGELVKNHLEKLQPDHSSDYVLVSQIYARSGHWNDVLKVREVMKNRRVEKREPGNSSVDIVSES